MTTPAANPPKTEGLTPLDRDRAASIADEGGASAATVDAKPVPESHDATDAQETLPLGRRPLEKK